MTETKSAGYIHPIPGNFNILHDQIEALESRVKQLEKEITRSEAVSKAVAAERERCAKICEIRADSHSVHYGNVDEIANEQHFAAFQALLLATRDINHPESHESPESSPSTH